MIKCLNWILLDKFKEDRRKYEEYVKSITKEKVMLAKEKLTEIDIKTLRLINQFRILTSSQIAKTIHKGRTHPYKFANNSLKKMFDLGCIDRFYPFAQNGSSQTHVVLAPIGARLIDVKGFRKVISLPQNWRHTIYRNDIFAHIYNTYKVIEWRNEVLLEWTKKGVEKNLRPDSFAGWLEEEETFAMFEVDLATEHMNVLQQKVKNYREYFDTEDFKTAKWQPYENLAIIPKVIFVFNEEERAKELKKYINRIESNIGFECFTFDDLT